MKIQQMPRRACLIIAVVVLIAGYYGVRALTANGSGQLKASGTIETVSVNISPELSGKVKEVLVEEGQSVKAGDALLVLDGTLLQEQRKVAAAGLESAKAASQTAANALEIAKAQYQQALEAALAQGEGDGWRTGSRRTSSSLISRTGTSRARSRSQAVQAQIDEAQKALGCGAGRTGDGRTQSVGEADFLAAEQRVLARGWRTW